MNKKINKKEKTKDIKLISDKPLENPSRFYNTVSVSQPLPLVAYLRGLAYSFLGFSSCQPRKNNKQIVQWENNCSRSAEKNIRTKSKAVF